MGLLLFCRDIKPLSAIKHAGKCGTLLVALSFEVMDSHELFVEILRRFSPGLD
jgi:hypothetical protein